MGIGLLGPLEVTTDAGAVQLSAAKERAVLARLALDAGRTVRVEALVDALWGDDPPATAVKTVQTYVARLRRALPEGWISSQPDGYVLEVDDSAIDVSGFERAIDDGRAALRRGDPAGAAALLSDALALWRGPPLADLASHSVGQAAAARLLELRLAAEDDLADARLGIAPASELVADLEEAVRVEPLRERRWAQLMLALYRSGRQADALRAFQRARAELAERLGIEPGPDLRQLERAILVHDPALDEQRAVIDGARPDHPLPGALSTTADADRIAGRVAELAQLAALLASTREGASRAVVVHGEPGIGKTRLIAEAAREAHADGAVVLFGRCDREGFTPYQAVVDALRSHVHAAPRAALAAVPAWQAAELTRLMPELSASFGNEPGAFDDTPTARHRLFDAVATYLGRERAGRSLVLVVDDLQWIDAGGAALLRHLLRAIPAGLLLLASYRAGDLDSDRRLADAVAELRRAADTTMLPLGALDEDAVRELAGDDATAVLTASGGSPLFVTELLRFRSETGRLPTGDEVPAGVRHAVDRRVAALDTATRRLVEVAAVSGASVSVDELAVVVGIAEPVAADLVDAAIGAYVLTERSGAAGTVAFTHELVRAALLQALTATRRRHLHRSVARTILERTAGKPGARAGEVAYHLSAAAPGEFDPAVARWAVVAAEHALSQLAWETAEARFALALDHLPVGATTDRAALLARLATTSRLAGRESAAKASFAEAVTLARSAGDRGRLADVVLAWTATPVDVRRELDEVIAMLRDVLGEMPDVDDARRAQLMARLAFSLAWAGDPRARALADDAVAMARRVDDRLALVRALLYSTSSRDQFEAYDPAGCAGELHRLATTIDDPLLVVQAQLCWLTGCIQRGDRAEVERALAELRELVDRHRLLDAGFRVDAVEGHLALASGDVDRAEQVADDLIARAAHTDLRNLFLFAASLHYDVRRAQGRLDELLPWFEEAHASGERIPRTAAMRVEVLAAAGRREQAAAGLAALVADDLAALAPNERPHSVATLAGVAVELSDADAAAVLHRALEPWCGLVVYDGTNGPLEPVDAHLRRLEALTASAGPR